MNDLVYLESDEEITSVIDKISRVSGSEVALVIPRGGNLAQSIVNLKLIKKRSADFGKDVSLVTTDKISRNLASQVGISVYSRAEEVGRRRPEPEPVISPVNINQPETIKSEVPVPEAKKPVEELPEIPGVRINRYYDTRPKEPQVQSPKSKENTPIIEEEPISEIQPTPRESEPTPGVTESVIELPPPEEEMPVEVSASDTKDAIPDNGERETDNLPAEAVLQAGEQYDRSDFKNRKIEDVMKIPSEELNQQIEQPKEYHNEPKHKKQEVGPPVAQRMRAGRRFKPMRKRRALFILIASILIIILAFGYLLLPQAKAVITFKADNFEESATVSLDKAATTIDKEKLVSPATESSVEKEVTDTFQASGQKNIGNKASGKVSLYNAGSSSSQKISAGQGLSYDSKRFVTKADVSIPGATVSAGNIVPGQSTVDVEATDSGEAYNIGPIKAPNKIVLDNYPSIQTWAESSAAFAGGSTQNVQIIQASDIVAAQDKIKARLSAEAKDEVLKKIPAIDKYVEGTIDEQITDLATSAPAGTQAPTFTFKGKIKTTILSFNETNLRDVITANYTAKLPANRVMVQPENITFAYGVIDKNLTAGSVNYKVDYKGKVSSKIDQQALKKQLSGQSLDEARRILGGLDLAKDVSITMTPNLKIYKTLPLLERSIKIETVYQVE